MKRLLCILVASALLTATARFAPPDTLDIYFIDVEGGQSTLLITPAGESLLIDAGFPGTGTFQSRPGETLSPRDPERVSAVARSAGLSRIDDLLITHFHGDHFGGVMELAQRLPIGTFIDHGDVAAETEQTVAGTLALFQDYQAVRAKGRHLDPAPGDHLPLQGLDVVVVSAAGATIAQPLAGGGAANARCGTTARAAQEPYENPRSTGVVVELGKFRFLDVGDLSGQPLFDLACPRDLVGPVDVYLVAHHGGADAADPATLAAFKPRAAVLDNGARKGAGPEMLATLHDAAGIDTWQLHRSVLDGARNFPDDRLANLDETTAHWIKVSAKSDGSFRVTNGRTGQSVSYGPR
ncbi:MAG TPA: MBL fold metallo-hydrolase [Vicinamibacterales bacterium]|nr:MBL fold metallo-hydrolase [Vicinamibacterales bacterium]